MCLFRLSTLGHSVELLQRRGRQYPLSPQPGDDGVHEDLEDGPHQHEVAHTDLALIDDKVVAGEQEARQKGEGDTCTCYNKPHHFHGCRDIVRPWKAFSHSTALSITNLMCTSSIFDFCSVSGSNHKEREMIILVTFNFDILIFNCIEII